MSCYAAILYILRKTGACRRCDAPRSRRQRMHAHARTHARHAKGRGQRASERAWRGAQRQWRHTSDTNTPG
eukprot:6197560-Pleurochrysis_carterae.AAC.5